MGQGQGSPASASSRKMCRTINLGTQVLPRLRAAHAVQLKESAQSRLRAQVVVLDGEIDAKLAVLNGFQVLLAKESPRFIESLFLVLDSACGLGEAHWVRSGAGLRLLDDFPELFLFKAIP